MLNPNHFVDRELLMGVSIGFRPPAILPKPVLMEDTMPNIISLPATRCPPLHLQAPDWQHLLRLMARLSNTRIEPTIESMAASKNEVKLRTVIQFIKPRANFNVWRTVLWFTIDHPIPEGKKFAQYHSGNPNLLPYSYVNEPLPVLLRDASDTNLSKTFTVPASEAVPLPTLPITFPNLALYLHAALQDSRRHSRSSEAASGLGKLGKMVQMCYPNVKELDNDDDFSGRSSSAVSGLFKRVIGRGNKDKRKGKNTNEETYQLVTPFVPDEWG
ncbi:hypothetical protein CPB83DRAFT_755036 [Crepidotus variabilis]|uniref:Uncharacterized protein n=1 Tax=Crepidotus variabilis TaxID=179855 RepID=A0A9P6ETZ3_9AGAR|nr:hypothetical protein CPB83DRAFT_755036 [Crepidotus variabilis]